MGGTIRLFKFSGIQVYLHFSWFLVAAYELTQRKGVYSSPIWAIAEYVSLFAIVLLHEFGHALACRQTGGVADRIVLWPLGGIAFVNPPRRPGAMLWSIAAGPLVNVVLLPILFLAPLVIPLEPGTVSLDLALLLRQVWWINLYLLIFNMLPVYPLDGGQILRALLWFPLGEIRSLQIASVVGLIGGACLALIAVWTWSFWLGILAFFIFSRAVAGWQYSKALVMEEQAKRAAPLVPTVPEAERPTL
jgi:Zn-dependent protease